MQLEDWIKQNYLDVHFVEPDLLFLIPDVGTFLVVRHKRYPSEAGYLDVVIDQDFKLILDETEESFEEYIDFYCFSFGGKWYYSPKEELQLNLLKYLGKAKLTIE